MRSAFWAELRRSPLRWWLPVLAGMHLIVVSGGFRGWLGVWPRASAEALRPVVLLGPVLAAGAAWAGARSGLPGVPDRLRGLARAGWVADAAQLASSVVIGLGGYLAGVVYVAWASFSQAGPGFLWPGYLLLGAAATVACAAIGHVTGRITRSRFGAPVAAGAGCLVLMMAFSSLLGLTAQGDPYFGDPAFSVAPGAIVIRALLAFGLAAAAVTVPSLLGRSQWRPARGRWLAGVLAVTAVVAGAALLPAQQVLAVRAAPADPACSATVPRVCVWPEDRPYLKALTALALRARQLPQGLFRVPGTFYEQGLRPGTLFPVPSGPVSLSLDGISLSDGSIWLVASEMEAAIYANTFGSQSCLPQSMSQAAWDKLDRSDLLLTQWLTTRIYGGAQPPAVSGGPPGVDPAAISQLAQEPEPAQAAFARDQAKVQAQYDCKLHATN